MSELQQVLTSISLHVFQSTSAQPAVSPTACAPANNQDVDDDVIRLANEEEAERLEATPPTPPAIPGQCLLQDQYWMRLQYVSITKYPKLTTLKCELKFHNI